MPQVDQMGKVGLERTQLILQVLLYLYTNVPIISQGRGLVRQHLNQLGLGLNHDIHSEIFIFLFSYESKYTCKCISSWVELSIGVYRRKVLQNHEIKPDICEVVNNSGVFNDLSLQANNLNLQYIMCDLSLMYQLMSLQTMFPSKRFFTLSTLKKFLPCVRQSVTLHKIQTGEGFLTFFAFLRLPCRVSESMSLQITSHRKLFVTHLTFIRLPSRVIESVSLQITSLSE